MQRWRGRFVREILSTVLLRNTIYQTHPSYQTSGLKFKKKKKSIPYIYLGGELDLLSLMDYIMGKEIEMIEMLIKKPVVNCSHFL